MDYPFVYRADRLKVFLQSLPRLGVPAVVDEGFLHTVGFSHADDASLLDVLRFISMIDRGGKPTRRWEKVRDPSVGPVALAAAVRNGYAELFERFPDAHERDYAAFRSYFAAVTAAEGADVVRMATTFEALCQVADFSRSAQPAR